jgi:hypothetical protein
VLFVNQPKFPQGPRPQVVAATSVGTGATLSSTRAKFDTYSVQGNNTTSGSANYHQFSDQNMVLGLNDFTVEFWMYSTAKPTWFGGLITLTSAGGDAGVNAACLYYQNVGTNGTVGYYNNGNTAGNNSLDPSVAGYAISLNVWNHIAYCRETVGATNTYRFYLNGVQQASGTTARTQLKYQNVRVGYGFGGITGMNSGTYLDELRITNGLCRYKSGTTFTPTSSAFVNDQQTVLLAHFENNFNDDATTAV